MSLELLLKSSKENDLSDEHKKIFNNIKGTFSKSYQKWYTESHAVIAQIIPNRLAEFESLYHGNGRRKEIDESHYYIQDYLSGITLRMYDSLGLVASQFGIQLGILESANSRFESSLLDIALVLRADLFDSELDAAKHLCERGFYRGGGAIAGVVLEKHLTQVCINHNTPIRKKAPRLMI